MYKRQREGAFFPHVHLIENEHVEQVLERLQIYKKGVIPEDPDVCFIESVKGQFPDDVILKLKHDIRSEHVSIPSINKICERNKLFVKIRMDKYLREHIRCGNEETALFKADICKVGDHYFRFIENTGVTSYFLKHYGELKEKADGHTYFKAAKRTKDRFINSFNLVNELMKQKDKLLEDASYDLIREFRSEKIDPEKVYEFNVKDCCRPIQNPANEEPKPKPRPLNFYKFLLWL